MLTPQVTSRLTLFVVSSPDPAKKSLLKMVWLALLARFALTLQMTVCSTSGHKEKHVEINTGCYRNKLSEFESLESSDSVQRNEGGQGYLGRQPGSPKKSVAGTVAHQSVLIAFHLSLHIFCFSLGRNRSCPVASVLRSNLSTHRFFACQPIMMFLNVNPSRSS